MKLVSIATHIQNKGLYIGYRQIYLDFALSNVPYDYPVDEKALAQAKEYDPEDVLIQINQLAKTNHQAICLGGGEPLLQVDYLKPLLEKELPLPVCLETNATLPKHLAEIKDKISIFSINLKPDFTKEFIESMSIVKDEDVFVRLVSSREMTAKKVESFAKIIAEINQDIPLIIEPLKDCKEPLPLQAMAQRHLNDVRVIPAIQWGAIHG
ncbi:MAG: radical SAM protein [Candidatus Margulisbacteria bacterium]|nr:radical SAM protein [Candidatus Margulisiibacteriota bacterium]